MSLYPIFKLAVAGSPDLPANDEPRLRWTPARKEAVVLHILDQENGKLKSIEAAVEHYAQSAFSKEEIEEWINHYTATRGKRNSLKSTKLQNLPLDVRLNRTFS